MRCSYCDAENPPGKKFCGDCGAPLANLCPQCGADNPAGKRFCGECGTALGGPAAAVSKKAETPAVRVSEAVDPEKLEGERKTVTALFADIKGSTELMEDLDPEEARAMVDPALKLMIDAARRYDGYVVQSTGDGIFALFGAPLAHEDHPQRALYAALRLQEELRRYSAKLRETGNLPIEARVGVNTGEVVVRSHHHRAGADRIYADRAYHQSRVADAGAGADRINRGQREDAQAGGRIFRAETAGPDQGQRRERAGQCI